MRGIKLLAALTLVSGGAALAQHAAPVADANAASNPAVKDSSVVNTPNVAEGANSFTEAQARKRIGDAGYTNISNLHKDSAGLWQASASKMGRSVAVALDYKGNVTSK